MLYSVLQRSFPAQYEIIKIKQIKKTKREDGQEETAQYTHIAVLTI